MDEQQKLWINVGIVAAIAFLIAKPYLPAVVKWVKGAFTVNKNSISKTGECTYMDRAAAFKLLLDHCDHIEQPSAKANLLEHLYVVYQDEPTLLIKREDADIISAMVATAERKFKNEH